MWVKFDGDKLRKERCGKGISQALLAEKIDSTIRYIRALETGEKSNPSAKLLYQIGTVLDTSMENFMEIKTEEE